MKRKRLRLQQEDPPMMNNLLRDISREEYEKLPPIHQGWFSHVQVSNWQIPHSCPYMDSSWQAEDWNRGWIEAQEDLAVPEEHDLVTPWR